LLHEKKFFAGNVRETPIAQIYDESDVLKYVRKLNVESVSGCKKCSVRYLCAGACRGRAYLDSGSLKVSGKFCDYEFNSIIDGLFKNCRKIEMN
jgi:radical SAM protein with 4Fe4S-binding SPASM domain